MPGDEPWLGDPACTVTEEPLEVITCRYGSGTPTAKVALVGDSHAQHWRGALHRFAEANGCELVETMRGGCPVTSARAMTFGGPGRDHLQKGRQCFAETWTGWADSGALVFVLRDVPTTGGRFVPECLALHAGAPLECARPRRDALRPDAMTLAASRVTSDRIHLVDLTDNFCDETTCHAANGQAVVHHDADHISASFSRSLAPCLLDRIAPVWAGGDRPS